MKVSARNRFEGRISALHAGAVNSEVELLMPGGDRLIAIVTHESVRSLALAVGSAACAMIKASSVMVMTAGDGTRLSARNLLPGKITHISQGLVNAEVALTLRAGAPIHATVASHSVAELGLRPGMAATAVIKASSVTIAVGRL